MTIRAVSLRPVVADDLPTFYLQQRDPEATRMAAFFPRTREAFDAHWERILVDPAVRARTVLFGDLVAGNVLSFDAEGHRLVGYWIDREHWGRGIATEALRLFLAEESSRPLRALVATHNTGSLRVLDKCGFRVISRQRGADGIDEQVLELAADRPPP